MVVTNILDANITFNAAYYEVERFENYEWVQVWSSLACPRKGMVCIPEVLSVTLQPGEVYAINQSLSYNSCNSNENFYRGRYRLVFSYYTGYASLSVNTVLSSEFVIS